ncbi:DUF2970 domain-containing protein [Pseudidiomarina marina]|uniref:DUF2970 domain-containing protein n=1 Tax=Pseudidiomarina marina TaxID=502366 RepID=A0A432YEE2_9GAMM|nr:DUF2970 domain-containing protein [Pseudidiomarina marina]PHR66224.1 MAG: hypothetical protein COA51_02585 [Idiomarina sp.]RUO59320.1 hypothetical protein CWI76_09830 [Pseudidiomarina marina]
MSFVKTRAKTNTEQPNKPSVLDIIISVLAALFGVQSDKNRQRDFNHGNPVIYVAVGAVFVILFVLTLVLVVSWVVPNS